MFLLAGQVVLSVSWWSSTPPAPSVRSPGSTVCTWPRSRYVSTDTHSDRTPNATQRSGFTVYDHNNNLLSGKTSRLHAASSFPYFEHVLLGWSWLTGGRNSRPCPAGSSTGLFFNLCPDLVLLCSPATPQFVHGCTLSSSGRNRAATAEDNNLLIWP